MTPPHIGNIEFQVSREAVLDARLFELAPNWNEVGEPLGYEVDDIPEATYPDKVVSLFQADCAAVRAVRRLEDGRKHAAIVIVRPPLSHKADDVLVDLTKASLERAITAVTQE